MLSRQEWSIPKVQPVAKPSVFSLESLIAWLEQQPAAKRYDWICSNGGCLFGKYSRAKRIDFSDCHHEFYLRDELHIASEHPWTFGAALDRARSAQRGG